MNYAKKSFSVTAPGTQSYADNWERTFRGPQKLLRRPPTGTNEIFGPSWTGPLESDCHEGTDKLVGPVPTSRWPYGPPNMHERCCLLRLQGGLYCDCKASAAGERNWGFSG